MICVLAGGVGAARLLRGLVTVVEPAEIVVVGNVGDDTTLHGLHLSPDLDTVVYTLADAINPATGWGLRDETWNAMESLERYGGVTWFRLGDRDLATHMYRTHRLAEGATLSEVTAEIARAWDLDFALVPVTDDPLETMVELADGGEIGFQDYFVKHAHSVPIRGVRFAGADRAAPAPGVLEALESADAVVIAPSNPLVSIGPLLAVPGVRDALAARRAHTVAVSPIVGGRALKGPAAAMLVQTGHDASVAGVARMYADIAATLVVDTADRDAVAAVEAAGMAPVVTDTIMTDVAAAADLARAVLAAAAAGVRP